MHNSEGGTRGHSTGRELRHVIERCIYPVGFTLFRTALTATGLFILLTRMIIIY